MAELPPPPEGMVLILQMFTHGMGGLMDRPLYSYGQLDRSATERRDALAHQVYQQARELLE